MKPGDLVQICPAENSARDAYRKAQKHFMKVGVVVSHAEEQYAFHPYFRIWQVLVEGKVIDIQGMDLRVLCAAP